MDGSINPRNAAGPLFRVAARLGMSVVLCSLGAAWGCTPSHPPAAERTATAPSASASQRPLAQSVEIDEMFRRLQRQLPEAVTVSEMNGHSLECPHHGSVTYTLLDATAAKVPIASDADLASLVPWCRHADVCVRQIALSAAVAKIGYDRNELSLPSMHDPEHYLYHHILLKLKARLDRAAVAYGPDIFEGLLLEVGHQDFAALIHGKWEEDVDRKTVNFADSVEVDADYVRVRSKHTEPDPNWPDHTWTTKIKAVKLSDERQYVVTGAWDMESNAKGYQGAKSEPSQFVYYFWPVKTGVVWFKGGTSAYWKKLRRPASP